MKICSITLTGDTTVEEAVKSLDASGGSSIAVVGDDGRVTGLFSRKVFLYNGDSSEEVILIDDALSRFAERPVSEFMSKNFLLVSPLESALSIARSFMSAPTPPEAIFVVDDMGLPLGVIERGDVGIDVDAREGPYEGPEGKNA